ncbi:MAG: dUTP diphosphatase [Rhodospirillaceae bacterium]|nr:dUTP diphosphatase [Rhodospirillaceae bacterium]
MTEPVAPLAVPLRRLPHGADLPLPAAATPGAAAVDLRAAVAEPLVLAPLARALVPTGIAIALPAGWEAQIRPRSGLALAHGLTVLNAPGTIDADYRGEIGVILINLGDRDVTIVRGDRIAQMLVAPCRPVAWQDGDDDWPDTARATGGFGSTGTR